MPASGQSRSGCWRRSTSGAFIANRAQTVETARELGRVWTGLSRAIVFPLNPVTGLLGFLGARDHLVPESGLRGIVKEHMSFARLEESAVPLHLIATDLLRGEDVRLSEGPLLDAVMASAAIPGVLPAVEWDGRELIDGGVTNNAPLSHALELDADEIYVLPPGTPCELEEAPRGALAMVMHASGVLLGRRFAQEVGSIPPGVDVAVLPPPCPLGVQPTDFSRAMMLIEQGLADARRYLDRRERRRRLRAVRQPASLRAAAPPHRAAAGRLICRPGGPVRN